MHLAKGLLLAACALPLGAAAQAVYSPVWVEPAYNIDRLEYLRVCNARNETLWDRKSLIDQDRRVLDSEGESIAHARAELDRTLAALDRSDTAALNAYNQRSMELNQWVDAHNRRVAELNGAAALLNSNSRALADYCDNVYAVR